MTVAGSFTPPVSPLTSLPHPRAILFDWDNTLAKNWEAIAIAMNAALESQGHPAWSEAQIRDNARFALSESFPRIFGDTWQDAREVYYRAFADNQLKGLMPMTGAEALLDYLRERSIWSGVVSNKRGEFLRQEVEILGWSSHFRAVVGADDAAAPKPSPAPVHHALKLGRAPVTAGTNVWFMGDSETDIACAKNAGCTAILIACDMLPANAHLANARFPDLEEFTMTFRDMLP